MQRHTWQRQIFPTDPGNYWFYGFRYKDAIEPTLAIAMFTDKIFPGKLVGTINGMIIHPVDMGDDWFFAKIENPELPII